MMYVAATIHRVLGGLHREESFYYILASHLDSIRALYEVFKVLRLLLESQPMREMQNGFHQVSGNDVQDGFSSDQEIAVGVRTDVSCNCTGEGAIFKKNWESCGHIIPGKFFRRRLRV